MKITNSILTEMVKQELFEKTVRLSTMKDANFVPGQFVQLMGKKGMVKLDKKSVHSLAKIVRQLSGKKGMGWSFTQHEGKLTELAKNLKDLQNSTAKNFGSWKSDVLVLSKKLSGSEKKKIQKDITTLNKLVYGISQTFEKNLDEGKLNEGSKVVTLPNGIKVKIDFKGLTLQSKGNPVFLDRREMMTFFKATARYLK